MAKELVLAGIPVTLILDSGVAYMMETVDMVLVGAEGVVESGGIINMLGTYQTALVASSMKKPVYVAAESYKVCMMVTNLCHCKVYDNIRIISFLKIVKVPNAKIKFLYVSDGKVVD